MRIGILALQGAVSPHVEKLKGLGASPAEVRVASDLDALDGIILPGGESTTMIHLLHLNQLWDPLKRFVARKPTWGVCAGAILLAKKVSHPRQASLEAMEMDIERNAFGRQKESFIAPLVPVTDDWSPMEGVFIRAPRIRKLDSCVRILFKWKDEPVMVEQLHYTATTFHPELTDNPKIHEYFLKRCQG